MTLPADLDELVADLRSPDPAVRDDHAYGLLAERVRSGKDDAHLADLGDAAVRLLADQQVHGRSFGALLLGLVVQRCNDTAGTGGSGVPAMRVVTWLAAFLPWYAEETDLRGHDDELGWLHAVAHGADALGAFGGSRLLGPAELLVLLDVARERLQRPTAHHLTQGEDDRLAVAVLTVLQRDAVPTAEVAGWVDRLADSWRSAAPGAVEPAVDNTLRFARTLHLLLTLGLRAEPDAPVRHPATRDDTLVRLGAALADVRPTYGRPA